MIIACELCKTCAHNHSRIHNIVQSFNISIDREAADTDILNEAVDIFMFDKNKIKIFLWLHRRNILKVISHLFFYEIPLRKSIILSTVAIQTHSNESPVAFMMMHVIAN